MDWCRQERPELQATMVRDKFRDYWIGVPGARGRKLDWMATWRNFVRSERAPVRGRSPPRDTTLDRLTGKQRKDEVVDVEAVERVG